MDARRVIVLVIFFFLLFLGIYTWNARTGKWDALGANIGLEVSGGILRVVMTVNDSITSVWDNYWNLVDVRQENEQLKLERDSLQFEVAKAREDASELKRLRELFAFKYPFEWDVVGARLLAWRLGANDFLDSFVVSKGFLNGAKPGTPIIVPSGLLGRVLKAGPYTSIALLITDPGSSVAVMTSKGRISGIVQGEGVENLLSMRFVKQNETIAVGEILITSGMDLSYPKGIAVARVVSVAFGANAMLNIKVEPLIDFEKIEEVLLLQDPFRQILPKGSLVYSPRPSQFFAPKSDDSILSNINESRNISNEGWEKQKEEFRTQLHQTEGANSVNVPLAEPIQERNN